MEEHTVETAVLKYELGQDANLITTQCHQLPKPTVQPP